MQRSFSSSYAEHQRSSSTGATRHLPLRHLCNNGNDYYSSDTDCVHRTYLQRASSTSSFSSIGSVSNPNYRILPVRYSSVDRILPKITANERGINVRICFDRPHHLEEYEHYRRRQMMKKQEQQHGSCPMLNTNNSTSTGRHPSNITYIETRSIVRDCSNDRLNNHSNLPIVTTRIKQTNSSSSREE